MGICLVTKLQASINDANLTKLGSIILNVNGLASAKQFAIIPTTGNTLALNCVGGTFSDGTTSKEVLEGGITATLAAGTFKVDINSKYNLKSLVISNLASAASINIDDLKYAKTLETLNVESTPSVGDLSAFAYNPSLNFINVGISQVHGSVGSLVGLPNLSVFRATSASNINGNVSAFANHTNLTDLRLSGTGVGGDIASFGKLTNLNALWISNTQIGGTIESFVQAQRANGRTSYTTTAAWGIHDSLVTFNGSAITSAPSAGAFSWTPTTITLNGVTINA